MKRLLSVLLVALLLPVSASAAPGQVVLPSEGYYERQTLKGFGHLVDDAFHAAHRELFPNNGFANQFTGYHAAVDVEYYQPADLAREIPIKAIADGQVVYFGRVSGYGGLIIIRHAQPESVTSLYGHVRLSDATVRNGQNVQAGQTIAYLGANFSAATSGARKHLHFGIGKGPTVRIEGHEQNLKALHERWHSPNDWLARYLPQPTPTVTPEPSPSISPVTQSEPTQPPERSWLGKLWDWLADLFS